jgi:hypothetical protein
MIAGVSIFIYYHEVAASFGSERQSFLPICEIYFNIGATKVGEIVFRAEVCKGLPRKDHSELQLEGGSSRLIVSEW